MKKEQIYEALGNINENYIRDAHEQQKKKSITIWFAHSPLLKWGTMAVCLCLMIVAVFAVRLIRGPEDVEGPYAYTIGYGVQSDDQRIYDEALNKDLLQSEPNEHFPIFRIETLEDLNQFKSKYENILSLELGLENVRSFEAALKQAQFDREIFYEEHSMLIIYIPTNNNSLRFHIGEIITKDDSLCFSIIQEKDQEVINDEITSWILLVSVEKNEIQKYDSFDALLDISN